MPFIPRVQFGGGNLGQAGLHLGIARNQGIQNQGSLAEHARSRLKEQAREAYKQQLLKEKSRQFDLSLKEDSRRFDAGRSSHRYELDQTLAAQRYQADQAQRNRRYEFDSGKDETRYEFDQGIQEAALNREFKDKIRKEELQNALDVEVERQRANLLNANSNKSLADSKVSQQRIEQMSYILNILKNRVTEGGATGVQELDGVSLDPSSQPGLRKQYLQADTEKDIRLQAMQREDDRIQRMDDLSSGKTELPLSSEDLTPEQYDMFDRRKALEGPVMTTGQQAIVSGLLSGPPSDKVLGRQLAMADSKSEFDKLVFDNKDNLFNLDKIRDGKQEKRNLELIASTPEGRSALVKKAMQDQGIAVATSGIQAFIRDHPDAYARVQLKKQSLAQAISTTDERGNVTSTVDHKKALRKMSQFADLIKDDVPNPKTRQIILKDVMNEYNLMTEDAEGSSWGQYLKDTIIGGAASGGAALGVGAASAYATGGLTAAGVVAAAPITVPVLTWTAAGMLIGGLYAYFSGDDLGSDDLTEEEMQKVINGNR